MSIDLCVNVCVCVSALEMEKFLTTAQQQTPDLLVI